MVEKYAPLSCRVRGAQYPVVVVLFSFVGVQESVSRHLVLFAICGPAGIKLLPTERQQACRHCNMTSGCHIGGPYLMTTAAVKPNLTMPTKVNLHSLSLQNLKQETDYIY